jgi:hypothetical protein
MQTEVPREPIDRQIPGTEKKATRVDIKEKSKRPSRRVQERARKSVVGRQDLRTRTAVLSIQRDTPDHENS